MRNSALEGYIGTVAEHLKASGYPVPDWHANDDDPRDGAIHLRGDREDGETEVWLGWHEESGWYRGFDRTGEGLSGIRWAWISVLATPPEVLAWLQRIESSEMSGWEMNRPYFRNFDDEDDFEELLTKAAEYLRKLRGVCRACGRTSDLVGLLCDGGPLSYVEWFAHRDDVMQGLERKGVERREATFRANEATFDRFGPCPEESP